jgi:hypothetical protein
MSVNNTCAISSSISFLISAAIWIHMEMPSQGYSQAGCRESSGKLATREIAPHRKGVLPISIQSVYSFQIVVPVVQLSQRETQPIVQGFVQERRVRCFISGQHSGFKYVRMNMKTLLFRFWARISRNLTRKPQQLELNLWTRRSRR